MRLGELLNRGMGLGKSMDGVSTHVKVVKKDDAAGVSVAGCWCSLLLGDAWPEER